MYICRYLVDARKHTRKISMIERDITTVSYTIYFYDQVDFVGLGPRVQSLSPTVPKTFCKKKQNDKTSKDYS